MKDTGIIMSGNHPKLVLDGLKTQTRRVIKPQPIVAFWAGASPQFQCTGFGKKLYSPGYDRHTLLQFCPYGQVGDRLWGRETYGYHVSKFGQIHYKADDESYPSERWYPSIHMFKKDARIWLDITEVRVERVQEISEKDAKAEGL